MKKVWLMVALIVQMPFVSALKVAVFCSADNKVPQVYKDTALNLGKQLAEKGHFLVTGGSNTGLMDAVGKGYHDGPFFLGIMPDVLKKYDVKHPGLAEVIWTSGMHERLQKFHEHSDAVIVLPGGFGTLHELLDFLVHQQFSLIPARRLILLNTNGFWNGFITQLYQMRKDQTITDKHLNMIDSVDSVEACLNLLASPYGTEDHGLSSLYWEEKK